MEEEQIFCLLADAADANEAGLLMTEDVDTASVPVADAKGAETSLPAGTSPSLSTA